MRRTLALAALVALGAGCGSSQQVTMAMVDWEPCPMTGQPTRECRRVNVPIDYADPAKGVVRLSVSRLPATDRANKVGVLVIDPGGPGISGVYTQANVMPPEVRSRFDVIGIDRRGVRQSEAVDCGEPGGVVERMAQTGELPQDFTPVDRDARAYVEWCVKKYGALVGHLGTRDAARDVEEVRKAIGADRVNLLMTSYGTAVGQTYLAMFPEVVRAAVLDGVVDPSQSGPEFAVSTTHEQSELEAPGDLRSQLQVLLAGFAPWCASHADLCPLSADPLGLAVSGGKDDSETMIKAASAISYFPERWPGFGSAVGDAEKLEKVAELEFPKDVAAVVSGTTPLALTLGTHCADFAFPTEVGPLIEDIAHADSQVAAMVSRDYVSCAVWPRPQPPLGALVSAGGTSPLLVNAMEDPRTPLRGARTVAARFKAPLVTVPGARHGVLTGGNSCAATAAMGHLVELKTPVTLTCP